MVRGSYIAPAIDSTASASALGSVGPLNPDLFLILATVAFAFLVKGVAGFGGPLLAVPIIAPTLGVEHAVVVVSIGSLVSNVMMLWEHRTGFVDTRPLLVRLLSAGAAGTVLGTWLLTRLDNRPLALAVAALVLGYIAVSLARPDLRMDPARGLKLAWPIGAFGGLVHGATGNSGPVFGTFLHSLGLARSSFVFALTVPFLVFGSIQVVTPLRSGCVHAGSNHPGFVGDSAGAGRNPGRDPYRPKTQSVCLRAHRHGPVGLRRHPPAALGIRHLTEGSSRRNRCVFQRPGNVC